MASIKKNKNVKRNDAVKKRKNQDGDYLSGRPQAGNSKTTTGDGKMKQQNNKVGGSGSELPRTVVSNSKAKYKLPHISTLMLRERLIHTLALNSYTQIELRSMLQSEGVSDMEQKAMPIVLREIAEVREGAYSLRPHFWKDVNVAWPYYNAKQLLEVKIRKERSLRPPVTSAQATTVTSPCSTSTSRTRPPQHKDKPLETVNTSKRSNTPSSECQQSKKINTDCDIKPPQYDFSEYKAISNLEQRGHYKALFNRHYEEYMQLCYEIDDLKCSFRTLGTQILDTPAYHPEYERIHQCIVDKFKVLNSVDELKRNHHCAYLHDKLNHIMMLIKNYDQKCTENFNQIPTTKDETNKTSKDTGIYDILTKDLALSDSDSDDEIIAIPKSRERPPTKDVGAAKAPIETPPAKYDCIHDMLTNDLALSDSD